MLFLRLSKFHKTSPSLWAENNVFHDIFFSNNVLLWTSVYQFNCSTSCQYSFVYMCLHSPCNWQLPAAKNLNIPLVLWGWLLSPKYKKCQTMYCIDCCFKTRQMQNWPNIKLCTVILPRIINSHLAFLDCVNPFLSLH